MIETGIARYRTVQITTGSPGDLLLALYDGLFRFLQAGAIALRSNQRGAASHAISRAHAILSELLVSLDAKHAPELCTNLSSLYSFCLDHIIEANLRSDPDKLDEVARVLSPLREAFREAVAQVAKSGAPAGGTLGQGA